MFPIFAGDSASTGYNLTRSLRFRASASAYLNRTNTGTVTNNAVWTWSAWVKIGYWSPGNSAVLFGNGNGGTNECTIKFTNNQLEVINYVSSTVQARRVTTQVFRDPSAWYHIVVASNSSTALNIYVNGVQVTSFGTSTGPSAAAWALNTASTATNIGFATGLVYFDGYLTEVNFIDGQALTPSSFGSFNALTGVWQPAKYSGSYGTNGFYLPFTDNSALTTSSNVGLGKDFSGNGNYWTTNNISITAGVTYDSMTDVPTLTSATASNFAVWNPLFNATNQSVTNGNLAFVNSTSISPILSTIGVNTGKYYAEFVWTSGLANMNVGIANTNLSKTNYVGSDTNGFGFLSANGNLFYNNTSYAYGSAFPANATIMIAFDATNGKIWWGVNGTWVNSGNPATGANPGVAASGATINVTLPATTYFFASGTSVTNGCSANFGQQPFAYTPPTGYVSLNTYNLPTSTILQGNKVMDATLYTGNGGTQTITNAAGFKPDFVWYKDRSNARDHGLFDSVRGVTNYLASNLTSAEQTVSGVTAFNSNGFTLGGSINSNNSGETYVGWQWQAGQGSSSSNTNGSITSTVSVNASAGFSVVTYTGTGANATVGHGLGVAPSFNVVKRRNSTGDWAAQHSSVLSIYGNSYVVFLNTTDAALSGANNFNSTAPTSSVISVGTNPATNASGGTYVAYCWTPIAGYSAFGSYTGNGSTDGPFIYLGFRPKFIVMKCTNVGGSWIIQDTARSPYNASNTFLQANTSNADYTYSGADIDFVSNGFKIKGTDGDRNTNGNSYIYMAFAETPTKFSLAR